MIVIDILKPLVTLSGKLLPQLFIIPLVHRILYILLSIIFLYPIYSGGDIDRWLHDPEFQIRSTKTERELRASYLGKEQRVMN